MDSSNALDFVLLEPGVVMVVVGFDGVVVGSRLMMLSAAREVTPLDVSELDELSDSSAEDDDANDLGLLEREREALLGEEEEEELSIS